MKINVVGSSRNNFLPLDNIREKFLVDVPHEGSNIDNLNPWYCELTSMYYQWKHSTEDIIGLEHYRRYFINSTGQLLNENEIKSILLKNDIILYKFNGCNSMTHMCSANKKDEFATALAVLDDLYGSEMGKFFFRHFLGNYVYLGNMFIAKKELMDKFFEFIFNILSEFDKLHNFKTPRIDGYLCEYFMAPWFEYNNYKIYNCERAVYNKLLNKRIKNWE